VKLPIYLDNHATTPIDPRVIDEMMPFLTDKFGNIASSHCFGQAVRNPCRLARERVAKLIGALSDEIIFTSGATESNNLAIKGIAEAYAAKGRHIITAISEHKAVLDTCAYLASRGFEVTYLPVNSYGQISLEQIQKAMRNGKEGTTDRTILVSLMAANNEVGTFHPIADIGALCQRAGVVFHVDAAQAVGKIPLNVKSSHVDLLSISAHKIYGPKGVGALYIRRSGEKLSLATQMHGGGQEGGLRAGTLAVSLVVGLGKACEIAESDMKDEHERLLKLRERLLNGLAAAFSGLKVNGHPVDRLAGNLNVTFSGFDPEILSLGLKDIAVSSTSACSSALPKPSHVLCACGLSEDDAFASIRFGIGRFNTEEEIDFVVARITSHIEKFSGSVKARDQASALPIEKQIPRALSKQ
jgi:cysteine desulfurase